MNTFFKKAIALTLLVSACVVSKSVFADYYKGYKPSRPMTYQGEVGYPMEDTYTTAEEVTDVDTDSDNMGDMSSY